MLREFWVGRGRTRALVVGLTCVGAGLVAAPAAQAVTTVGQTVPVGATQQTGSNGCAADLELVNTSAVIPVAGTVTQFTFRRAANLGGVADFHVLRPTGNADQYTVVGRVSDVTNNNNANVNKNVPAAIPVLPGDRIGMFIVTSGFPCVGPGSNDSMSLRLSIGRPSVGSTITVDDDSFTAVDLNLRARIDERPTATVDAFSGNSPNPNPFGGGLTAGVLSGTASDDVDLASVRVNIRNPAGGYNQTFFAQCPGGCSGMNRSWTLNLNGLGLPKNRDLVARVRAVDSVGNMGEFSAPFAFHSNP